MKDLGNKTVLANNLKRHMTIKGVSTKELSATLEFPYTTVLSWLKAENYPRIDKIEAMADYFGVLKSDLIEDKKEQPAENKKEQPAGEDELSPKRKAFIDRVMRMSDEELDRLEQILDLVERKKK